MAMSSVRSRKEWVLLAGIVGSAAFLTALVLGASLITEQLWVLLFLGAPFMVVAYFSVFALARRSRFGAWGALVFFALQIVTVERNGAHVWPGYSVGLDVVVHKDPALLVSIG